MTRDDSGKKSYIKYSIKDSQNSFIKITETAMEMDAYLKKLSKNGNDPIQPCVLIVGSLFDCKEVLVYFDSIKYKLFSVLKAFDTCFKIFHVFNVEYPDASTDVWLFIQTFFYNINTKYDKSCAIIKQLSSEIKYN